MLTASAGTNSMVISWSGALTNYVLEATTNLQPPYSWSTLTNTPQTVGDQQGVLVAPASKQQFFRLRRQ